MVTWTDHVARWQDCTACPLAQQRTNIVLARGQVPCDVCFIGEAPGKIEDDLGAPFMGPAGHLMDQIIERAVPPGVTCALANLVCCFPKEAKATGDNEPTYKEIMACRPRLREFIGIADPRLIVTVGSLAEGFVEDYPSRRRLHIIHPAATFPPRMARIQAQAAINHAIVKLRCAVEALSLTGGQ
jgi:uracil-DNA glycosylase